MGTRGPVGLNRTLTGGWVWASSASCDGFQRAHGNGKHVVDTAEPSVGAEGGAGLDAGEARVDDGSPTLMPWGAGMPWRSG